MVKATLTVIGLILCIWGLSELIHIITLCVSCIGYRHKSCSVIWLEKDKAWKQLRFARLQIRWHGAAYADTVIAVTDCIEQSEAELLKKSFTDGFVFCPSDIVMDVVASITGENTADGRNDKSSTDRGNSGYC